MYIVHVYITIKVQIQQVLGPSIAMYLHAFTLHEFYKVNLSIFFVFKSFGFHVCNKHTLQLSQLLVSRVLNLIHIMQFLPPLLPVAK